eukprot:g9995.t1
MIATIVVRTINTIPRQSIQKRATCNIFKYVSGGGDNNSNMHYYNQLITFKKNKKNICTTACTLESINESSSREIYKDQDHTWVDKHMPDQTIPYLKLIRIDRPIGTMLLLWPCTWSISLAATQSHTLPDLKLMAIFGIGAFVMRGAGCTINDMWDKDFDKNVERTKNRPLASGRIAPFQALTVLGGQLSLGLGVLLQLNNYCLLLGASSLILVGSYPYFKRITHYPQAVLGLAFNWGALLGWAAVHGSCDWSVVLPLYTAGISWTMIYDTWYAHQDKEDDKKLGLKSTAIAWGNDTKKIAMLYSTTMVAGLGIAGYNAGLGESIPFHVGLLTTIGHLAWQISTADLDDRINLNNKFRSNNILGGVIFSSIVCGNVFL